MRPIDRREFLARAAAGAALVVAARAPRAFAQDAAPASGSPASKKELELRELGKTGRKLPRLGLACAPLATIKGEDKAVAVLARALELGVRYFDTSPDAGEGRAESLLGKAIRGAKREELWIATKMDVRTAAQAKAALKASLERLGTDYVDAVLIPAVRDREAASESDSVLDELRRGQRDKTVRFIGISSNKSTTYAKRALDRFPYDLALVPVNPGDAQRSDFAGDFVPFAAERKIAVVGMQIFGSGKRDDDALPRKECLTYALGQPHVDVIVPTCMTPEAVAEAWEVAAGFVMPPESTLREIEARAAKGAAARPSDPAEPPSKDEKEDEERR